jgi:hypothetical protein
MKEIKIMKEIGVETGKSSRNTNLEVNLESAERDIGQGLVKDHEDLAHETDIKRAAGVDHDLEIEVVDLVKEDGQEKETGTEIGLRKGNDRGNTNVEIEVQVERELK